MLHPWHSTIRSTKNDRKGRNSNYWRDVTYQIYPWPKLSMVLFGENIYSERLAERLSRHEILKARQREQPAVPGSRLVLALNVPEALITLLCGKLDHLKPPPKKKNGNCSKITPPKKLAGKKSLGDSAWITSLGLQWIDKMQTRVSFVFWSKSRVQIQIRYTYTIIPYLYILV